MNGRAVVIRQFSSGRRARRSVSLVLSARRGAAQRTIQEKVPVVVVLHHVETAARAVVLVSVVGFVRVRAMQLARLGHGVHVLAMGHHVHRVHHARVRGYAVRHQVGCILVPLRALIALVVHDGAVLALNVPVERELAREALAAVCIP